jgi:hypothetical protein
MSLLHFRQPGHLHGLEAESRFACGFQDRRARTGPAEGVGVLGGSAGGEQEESGDVQVASLLGGSVGLSGAWSTLLGSFHSPRVSSRPATRRLASSARRRDNQPVPDARTYWERV